MPNWRELDLQPWGPGAGQRHMEWYRRGKTAFIHFTVNTFTDREWGDGTEDPAVFAPGELDCRQWCQVLRDGGFTAAILTAKHHDGFCLWPTALTEHSVKNSPLAGRDVVREFVDACREFGIKPGLYLSPWDRNCPHWGKECYNDFYAAQLTELMTHYGPIWECWWDGAGSTQAHYDWGRWANIIRTYQPQCVIFGCLGAAAYADVRWVGNEEGRAGENCFGTIFPESLERENMEELNRGDPEGTRFIPAETNVSIRPGWFYHERQDHQVMTPERLMEYWFQSAGRNTAILLNLPPDRRGLIPEEDAWAVRQWNSWLQELFRVDLAQGAGIQGEPGGENLLQEDQDLLYIAGCLTPEVSLSFREPVRFDCFILEEAIELGHRVRGFRVEARGEDGWITLCQGQCIGFCRGERFAPVTAREVRIVITQAAAKPVLRRFRLHLGAAPRETAGQTARGKLELQSVTRLNHALEVELGGIFPFNTVTLSGRIPGSWRVLAFNGTRYIPAGESRENSCRFPTQTGSYRLRVETDFPLPEDIQPEISLE